MRSECDWDDSETSEEDEVSASEAEDEDDLDLSSHSSDDEDVEVDGKVMTRREYRLTIGETLAERMARKAPQGMEIDLAPSGSKRQIALLKYADELEKFIVDSKLNGQDCDSDDSLDLNQMLDLRKHDRLQSRRKGRKKRLTLSERRTALYGPKVEVEEKPKGTLLSWDRLTDPTRIKNMEVCKLRSFPSRENQNAK